MSLPRIRLKPREDRRLRAGHLWVFSNEIDCDTTPLTTFSPGQAVVVEGARGRPLGVGYVNPQSLISVRLFAADPHAMIDQGFVAARIRRALAWRERLTTGRCYRLVYGESDGLPGLVVDRYDDILVVQITTAGVEALKAVVIAALDEVVRPRGILLRNDTASRALEGLPSYVEVAGGTVPDDVTLTEGACRFTVSPRTGQKTGWFYDQRPNRQRLLPYVRGLRVLDLFAYVGGFGIQAAAAGAREVTLVDTSERALGYARDNAVANGVGAGVTSVHGDVFTVLKGWQEDGRRFDVIVCDPPALMKRRKDRDAGLIAYQRLNQAALAVLADDGVLLSSSCSYHLEHQVFVRLLGQAAAHLSRGLQIVETGGQGPDHPIHPAIAETAYLKVLLARSLGSS